MGKILTQNTNAYPIVKVCIPFYRSVANPTMSLIDFLNTRGIPGYRVATVRRETTIIHFSRNELVAEPKGFTWDYLFFIDDDTGYLPEPGNQDKDGVPKPIAMMKKILDHRLDICGGLYVSRGKPHPPLIYKKMPLGNGGSKTQTYHHIYDYPENEVIEVDGIGTGWLCIKHDVFYKIEQDRIRRNKAHNRYLQWLKDNPGAFEELPSKVQRFLEEAKPDVTPPFWVDYIFDEYAGEKGEWANVGEDIHFCKQAQKSGFKIYCDTSVQPGHQMIQMMTPSMYKYAYMSDAVEMEKRFFADKNMTDFLEKEKAELHGKRDRVVSNSSDSKIQVVKG